METALKLTILSKYKYVKIIKIAVEEFLKSLEVIDEDIFFLKLAVSEAILNIIEHAYKEENDGKIELFCKANGEEIIFILKDYSINASENFLKFEKDGLGLNIIKNTFDRVTFERIAEENCLTLTKKLKEENFALEVKRIDPENGVIKLGATCFTQDVREIRKAFDYLIENKIKNIVIDFGKVKKIDSSGIGVLVTYYKKSKEDNYNLVFESFSEEVKRIFKMINLYSELEITE